MSWAKSVEVNTMWQPRVSAEQVLRSWDFIHDTLTEEDEKNIFGEPQSILLENTFINNEADKYEEFLELLQAEEYIKNDLSQMKNDAFFNPIVKDDCPFFNTVSQPPLSPSPPPLAPLPTVPSTKPPSSTQEKQKCRSVQTEVSNNGAIRRAVASDNSEPRTVSILKHLGLVNKSAPITKVAPKDVLSGSQSEPTITITPEGVMIVRNTKPRPPITTGGTSLLIKRTNPVTPQKPISCSSKQVPQQPCNVLQNPHFTVCNGKITKKSLSRSIMREPVIKQEYPLKQEHHQPSSFVKQEPPLSLAEYNQSSSFVKQEPPLTLTEYNQSSFVKQEPPLSHTEFHQSFSFVKQEPHLPLIEHHQPSFVKPESPPSLTEYNQSSSFVKAESPLHLADDFHQPSFFLKPKSPFLGDDYKESSPFRKPESPLHRTGYHKPIPFVKKKSPLYNTEYEPESPFVKPELPIAYSSRPETPQSDDDDLMLIPTSGQNTTSIIDSAIGALSSSTGILDSMMGLDSMLDVKVPRTKVEPDLLRISASASSDHNYGCSKRGVSMEGLGVVTPSDSGNSAEEEEEIDVVSLGDKSTSSRSSSCARVLPQHTHMGRLHGIASSLISASKAVSRKLKMQVTQQVKRKRCTSELSNQEEDDAEEDYYQEESEEEDLICKSYDEFEIPPTPPREVMRAAKRPRTVMARTSQKVKRFGVEDPMEKRNLHNDMERKRRIGLNQLFQYLKTNVPEVAEKERASKVAILKAAALYGAELRAHAQSCDSQLSALRESQNELRAELASLRIQAAADRAQKQKKRSGVPKKPSM